jgi:uncharacterized membrane protein YqjE
MPQVVVEGLMHRGELAGIELREAGAHVAATVVAAGAGLALALLGGIAGTFAIAAAAWDSPRRGLILGVLTLAYLAGAGALAWWAARRFKAWRPLAETICQLREDGTCLHQYLSDDSR